MHACEPDIANEMLLNVLLLKLWVSQFVIDLIFYSLSPYPSFCSAEMWLSTMRNFPLASQEASGALEAYHVKLKA